MTSVPRIRKKLFVFIQNGMVHYRVQIDLPPAPISGQQSATHTLPSHILNIKFNNITHHQRLYLPNGLLQILPNSKFCVCHACHIPRSSGVPDLIITIISGKGENHQAMQYAIFSNLLFLPPTLWIQTFSTTFRSALEHTRSIPPPPRTHPSPMFHQVLNRTHQRIKLQFRTLHS
jgi:hypothetical protein